MAAFKVVITDTVWDDYDVEAQVLRDSGLDVDAVYLRTRDQAEIIANARDADAIAMCWAPIPRDIIASLTRCRVIVRFGIGVDLIDQAAATERGILVCNTARYCLDEVSTQAITFVLMLNRDVQRDIRQLQSGGWFRAGEVPPRRLAGLRLGLIGLGNIGQLVAAKARGLGLQVAAFDPILRRQHAEYQGVPLLDLDDLLQSSDFVSIHCPLNAATRHLIGERELALMKPTAYLVNTARGAIVDQGALVAALTARRIAGAALDVFEREPVPPDDPLRSLDNVIMTPHSASWSVESTIDTRRTAVEHVVTVLRGGIPTDVVNREVLGRIQTRDQQG